jgi:hypothetical protein
MPLPNPTVTDLADVQANIDALERPPSWQAPTLAAGWTDYGGTDATRRVGYSVSALGWVQLRGDANRASSTWTLPETIFTLPVGFRPVAVEHIYVLPVSNGGGSGMCRVRVSLDGTVSLRASYITWTGPGINLVSLDPIGFWAEG